MSLIPTVRRQSQVDLWVLEFEASLIYRVRSKTARVTHRNPDSAEGGVWVFGIIFFFKFMVIAFLG